MNRGLKITLVAILALAAPALVPRAARAESSTPVSPWLRPLPPALNEERRGPSNWVSSVPFSIPRPRRAPSAGTPGTWDPHPAGEGKVGKQARARQRAAAGKAPVSQQTELKGPARHKGSHALFAKQVGKTWLEKVVEPSALGQVSTFAGMSRPDAAKGNKLGEITGGGSPRMSFWDPDAATGDKQSKPAIDDTFNTDKEVRLRNAAKTLGSDIDLFEPF